MYATDTVPRRRVAKTTANTTTTMIFVATVMATVLAVAAGCPIGCMCKWKGGKQTVECVNRSLTAIPNGMDIGTQVLDMSGNSMDALSRGRFMSAGLSNLQKIFMARCRITYVDDAAFQGLSNLVELDLSDNGITDIPTKSFDDYPQLMKLVLSGNAVTVVRTAAFKRLAYLTVLDLSRCRVSMIEPGAFDGLHSIEWLRLDHNQIVRIESAGTVVLPLSLHGIEMHHNPWTCDCRLREVHQWLNNNSAPHTVEPTCQGPDRLRGMVIRKLDAEELACAPVAAAASPEYVETDAGKNVTLACRVTPAGQARVSWWFEGRQVANSTTSAGVELTVEDVGPADNGTYACVAENRAGWAACNFTVRVIQEPSEVAAGSYPPDAPPPALLVIVLAGSVCFVAVAVVCAISCRLLVVKRRRRRDHAGRPGGKSGGAGGVDAGADDPSNSGQGAKTTSDIRQSDSVNLTVSSTIDGKLSSAEDVSVYGEYDAAAGPGSSAGYEVHEVMHVGGGGGYDAYQQVHVAQGHPVTATTTTTLEANPDLISDASTVIKDNGGGDYRDASDEVYKITLPPPPLCGRDFWSTSGAVYPSGGGCGSYELQLSPGKLAAGEPYPADYGLPKLSSGQYPMPAPPSLYRTLPHRRNAAKPQGRSCQEAEFVLLQQHHHHHHHHHQQQQQHQHHLNRYEPQNIRYNQQGYPYPASAVAADGPYYATAAATFYEPPSLSNASAQTLDDETMVMMMMMPPAPPPPLVTGASALPAAGRQPQHLSAEHAASQHKAVTAVQKQPATTESPDEGYVGEGPDS